MRTSVLRGMQYREIISLERQLVQRLQDLRRYGSSEEIYAHQANIAWVQKIRQEKESDSRTDGR